MPRFLFAVLSSFLIWSGSSGAALSDPPARVGRLGHIEGQVLFQTTDQPRWTQAVTNYPVTEGSSFWTGDGSRSEMEIGPAEIRSDQRTEVTFQRLDDQTILVAVRQGVVNVHLRAEPTGGGFQIATSGGHIALVRAGSYHIDAGQPEADGLPGRMEVNVLDGEARLSGARAMIDILPGEGAILTPDGVNLVEANATPFDDWALARERRAEALEATRYVSTDMTGYQDLDEYGRWTTLSDVGPVWIPGGVPVGWAPYRFGHWAFIPPWGWTWIDDAPWGFAPFHYGRWVETPAGWGWCPGRVAERPVYAPALVTFIGGNGWSVSVSLKGATPAVGWVPLGPAEPFRPPYHVSPDYLRRVNAEAPGAGGPGAAGGFVNHRGATVVPAAAFAKAASVNRMALAVPSEQIGHAPVTADIGRRHSPGAFQSGVTPPSSPVPVAPAVTRAPVPGSVASHPAASAPASLSHATLPTATAPSVPAPTPHGAAPGAGMPHAVAKPAEGAQPHPWNERGSLAPPTSVNARPQPPMQPQAMPRPSQQTHLQPTPQGWVRQPAQAQPRPQPQSQATVPHEQPRVQQHESPHGNHQPQEDHH